MDEFAFIREHLAPFAGRAGEGLSDDCAWLPDGEDWLVVSTDTSVEGVHFPRGRRGAAFSERAVRVALSDLAAKAARPVGVMVGLCLPRDIDRRYVPALALGIREACEAFGAPLIGGDTTSHDGPLVANVTVLGRASRKVLREGARVGEGVWLTGPVGDASLGLGYLQGDLPLPDPSGEQLHVWENAYLRPEPAFGHASAIASASASIDVSDGLLADLGKVAEASGVALEIVADTIPLSDATRGFVNGDVGRLVRLATAGDDYAVAFTHAGEPEGALRIGRVVSGAGVRLLDADGGEVEVERLGYSHRL